jgi:HSP20 family protein
MTFIRIDPGREWATLSDRMRKFFTDISEGFTFEAGSYTPRVDVADDEEKVYVMVEVPGIKKDEIKLSIQDDVLTIKGEKKKQDIEERKNYYRAERCYGFFSRSFTLPVEVDTESIKAQLEEGVLYIEFPKVTKKSSEKSIDIK